MKISKEHTYKSIHKHGRYKFEVGNRFVSLRSEIRIKTDETQFV